MKTIRDDIDFIESFLIEMANLTPDETGLSLKVHAFSNSTDGRILPHGPRLKTNNGLVIGFGTASPSVRVIHDSKQVDSKTIADIFRFIEKNHAVLVDHWFGRISRDELLSALRPIDPS